MARNSRFANPPAAVAPPTSMAPREIRKQEFARALQGFMLQRNMSQADLARAAGLGRDSISSYVNGRNLPKPKSAQALADALGVTVPQIYPGAVERAVDAEIPAVELRQVAGHPGKAWLRVNRAVSFSTAAKIIALLEAEDASAAA
jgi:transcriptional regulator with XRE-family HTH domain